MSYQVLARKWRPSNFRELVGQEHVVAALVNALNNDRLHHAYLFTGTRGVGKTTIARILSKSLNCDTGITAEPCGKCSTCIEVDQGKYVDLLEIDAASRTKVEDTREILDNVQYKPSRGRFKVYLIDEVHMLSKHSFNALLKTLEEPPPHVKFLLATTDPQKLPITILSRCLQFNLKAMTREQISGQLSHILQHEQIPAEAEAIKLLAKSARGSMRDALSLTDQAVAQGNGAVKVLQVESMLGTIDKGIVLNLLISVIAGDSEKLFQQVEELSLFSPDYEQLLSELQALLHQIALSQFVPSASQIEQSNAKAILALAEKIPAEMVQLLYQTVVSGKKDLPYAPDGKSALEMTLLRMLAFKPEQTDINFDDLKVTIAKRKNTESSENIESTERVEKVESAENPEAKTETAIAAPVEQEVSDEPPSDSDDLNIQQQKIIAEAEQLRVGPEYTESQSAIDNQNDHLSTFEAKQLREQVVYPEPADADKTEELEDAFNPYDPDYQRVQGSMFGEEIQPVKNFSENVSDHSDVPDNEALLAVVAPESDIVEEQTNTTQSEVPVGSLESIIQNRNILRSQKKQLEDSGKKFGNSKEADLTQRLSKLTHTAGVKFAPAKRSHLKPEQATDIGDTKEISGSVDILEPICAPADVNINQHFNSETSETSENSETPNVQSAHQLNESASTDNFFPLDDDIPIPVKTERAYAEKNDESDFAFKNIRKAAEVDAWSKMIEDIDVRGLARQLALNSAFEKQQNKVILMLDRQLQHLNNSANSSALLTALQHHFGEQIELSITIDDVEQSPKKIQMKIDQARQQIAEQSVDSDPWIQSALLEFDARLVKESIKPIP